MFVAFPDNIKNQVQDVSPGNCRLQAVLVKCSNSYILIINSYFPVDKMTVKIDGSELSETIQFIKQIIENNEFSNLLLLGDINCDFLRKTGHTKLISSFLDEYNLLRAWDKFEVDFTLTHENNGKSIISTIDHFAWNEEFDSSISECGVLHSADNDSDHSPIYCVIENEQINTCSLKPIVGKEKPSWRKAEQDQKINFKDDLQARLCDLHIPSSLKECKDVHCKDICHLEECDIFMTNILQSVENSAFDNLPIVKPATNCKRKIRPGWSESVQPFRETAYFWCHKY